MSWGLIHIYHGTHLKEVYFTLLVSFLEVRYWTQMHLQHMSNIMSSNQNWYRG